MSDQMMKRGLELKLIELMQADWHRLLRQIQRAQKRGKGTKLTPEQVDMLQLHLSNGITD